MSATICPSCLSKSFEAGRCGKCGFTAAEYKPPRTALPLGTVVGSYRIGLMKSNSRQSQVYTAVHTETSAPVIIEEFFPAAMVGRVQGKTEVSLVKEDEDSLQRFQQGCLLLEASAQKRPLKRLESFRANNTVYSVFEPAGTVSVAAQCEMMADNPYYFRDQNGMPMMSINLLTIPPMPKQREYNPEQYKKQAPITQPAEEDDRFAGRIITENEKRQKRNRLIITLGSIAAALVVLVGVGFGTGLVQRIVDPKPTATPIPEVTETPKPEPTATTTPEPTQAPETLDAELFAPMLRLIPAKGKELNGIPVTEGNYDPEDAELQVLDQNVIPMRVNGKKDILYAIKDELYFIVQAENEDLYRVYAGKKGENGFTPNEDLMGLGFKLWTDVKDDNQETTLKKDTLVLITKREKSIQQEENWLQALYREPSQEEESIDEADVPAAEETGTPESGEGSDGEPESTESPQDQESVQADWTISTIRLVDNIDSEKKYTPDYWSQGQQGSGDLGSSGQQIAEIEKKPGADLIIQAGISNDKLYFHLEAISEPEEATEQERETEKPTEGNGAEESVLPVETDMAKPAEGNLEETRSDGGQQDGEIDSKQGQDEPGDDTAMDNVMDNSKESDAPPVDIDSSTFLDKKQNSDNEQLSQTIKREKFIEHLWLYSYGNSKGILDKKGKMSEPNQYLEGRELNLDNKNKKKTGALNSRIKSPRKVRLVQTNEGNEALIFAATSSAPSSLLDITKEFSNQATYYVAVEDSDNEDTVDKLYRVRIGKAEKVQDGSTKYKLPDDGVITRLAVELWHDIEDLKKGTILYFADVDERYWFEPLLYTLNDILKNWEDADYTISINKEGKPILEISDRNGFTYEIALEAGDPSPVSDTSSQDTGSTTESGAEQTGLSRIREVLPSSDVKAIYTTEAVQRVVVTKQDSGSEYELKKSTGYTTEHEDYMIEWRNEGMDQVFPEQGLYKIIYFGLDNQELGNEEINAIYGVSTSTI